MGIALYRVICHTEQERHDLKQGIVLLIPTKSNKGLYVRLLLAPLPSSVLQARPMRTCLVHALHNG